MAPLSSIGVFDSGYGGLTILKEIQSLMPQYNYKYLGDNARAPYGSRSFDTVYHYTSQCVKWLFSQNCNLIILACNTASAKALRTIQQKDLTGMSNRRKVLGVIRPTAETIGHFSSTNQIGILGTTGTIQSGSYLLEIQKFFPHLTVFQQTCPLWVPLIEAGQYETPGGQFFIKNDIEGLLRQSHNIDTILLGCTHYPLIADQIQKYVSENIRIISQGNIVAQSLKTYLNNHPEIEHHLARDGKLEWYTTDSTEAFNKHARQFYGHHVRSQYAAV